MITQNARTSARLYSSIPAVPLVSPFYVLRIYAVAPKLQWDKSHSSNVKRLTRQSSLDDDYTAFIIE
jgi:hypothetical protein